MKQTPAARAIRQQYTKKPDSTPPPLDYDQVWLVRWNATPPLELTEPQIAIVPATLPIRQNIEAMRLALQGKPTTQKDTWSTIAIAASEAEAIKIRYTFNQMLKPLTNTQRPKVSADVITVTK